MKIVGIIKKLKEDIVIEYDRTASEAEENYPKTSRSSMTNSTAGAVSN